MHLDAFGSRTGHYACTACFGIKKAPFLLQVLGDAGSWDTAAVVSALLQLVNILRGKRGLAEKAQQMQHPIVRELLLRIVELAPAAPHTVCTHHQCIYMACPSCMTASNFHVAAAIVNKAS